MAYNFSIQNGALRVFNDQDTSERYLFNASLERSQSNIIFLKESGKQVTGFQFIDFGTIGGVAPTNLDNAGDLIAGLIESLKQEQSGSNEIKELNAKTIQQFEFGLDAGGRTRISQITTLLDGKILGEDDTLLFENNGTGTGTYANNKVNLAVTSGQFLIRQSKRFNPYFSGKSQLIECTFDNLQTEADVTKRVGYFSSNDASPFNSDLDGFFIEDNGTIKSLKAFRNGTETINVPFTSMTNYSKIANHNWSNFNVIAFDFLWLGGAVLRFFVKTATGFELIHAVNYSGTATDTFILSPNQPIRYEIRSTTGTGSLRYICSQVASEGSFDESGKTMGIFNTTSIATNAVGTIYALLGIRKQASFRDTAIQILSTEVATTATSDAGIIFLISNPTLSAPLSYVNNGKIQRAIATNQTITAGTGRIIAATTLNVSGGTNVMRENFLAFLSGNLDNTMDEYVLAYIPTTNNQSVNGIINIKEF
jgi:hypothetical protein